LLTADRPLQVMTLKDFTDQDEHHYGLNGSPTQVEKIFPPSHTTEKQVLTGSGAELANRLFELLTARKMI